MMALACVKNGLLLGGPGHRVGPPGCQSAATRKFDSFSEFVFAVFRQVK